MKDRLISLGKRKEILLSTRRWETTWSLKARWPLSMFLPDLSEFKFELWNYRSFLPAPTQSIGFHWEGHVRLQVAIPISKRKQRSKPQADAQESTPSASEQPKQESQKATNSQKVPGRKRASKRAEAAPLSPQASPNLSPFANPSPPKVNLSLTT